MIYNRFLITIGIFLMVFAKGIIAQQDSTQTKEGLSFGVLPVVGYNSDIGFQYGLIFNLFNFGDGSLYPDYRYSIYTEWSRTSKGAGVNQIFFDSKYLLPRNIRITSDFSYLTELALNFYGFNGYEALYEPSFEDDTQLDYISRMFYRHQRKFLRLTTDLQGNTAAKNLKWLAGIGYFDFRISSVDTDKLNKGKSKDELLPDTTLLYDIYTEIGIIDNKEKDGGIISALKAGLIYDSRNREVNPDNGLWSEVILFYNTGLFNVYRNNYLKLSITHRQFLTLVKKKIILAYRIGYQGTLAGDVPFYMQPYMINSFSMNTTIDGLGGAKTLRGILRNRIVGDGVAYGNLELRWNALSTRFLNQNFYLAINGFLDAGTVVDKMNISTEKLNSTPGVDYSVYFSGDKEQIHLAAGTGIKIVMNDNFAVSVDYGKAFDKRDGNDGLYIGIGFLF